MTGAGPGLGKIENAGAGTGPGSEFFYCRGRAGIQFFLLPGPGFLLLPGPGPGRHRIFFYCWGRAGINFFFINGVGAGIKIFYCRGRGWAGIGIFIYCRAGPRIIIF